jgi:glycosyltransferase involved in cell wall biosynthesis
MGSLSYPTARGGHLMPSPAGSPRAHIRAVVPDQGAVADELRQWLAGTQLPSAAVEVWSGGDGRTAAEVVQLTGGVVDHLLLASADAAAWIDEARIESALAMLRRDFSTAAVGASATGAPEGELELAVSGEFLLVRAPAFRELGGWVGDPAPRVLNDLDLCARLWLTGWRVRSAGGGRRPLRGESAPAGALRTAVLRALAAYLDEHDLAHDAWTEPGAARTLADSARRRRRLESRRRRGSGELVPLLHRWAGSWREAGGPDEALRVIATHGAPERAGARRRIVVATTDVLAPAMAGPAIRAVEIARALADEHDVKLVTTTRCELEEPGVDTRFVQVADLQRLVGWADIVVFQGWLMVGCPWLETSEKVLVVDVYDPMHLEQLEQGHEAEGERGRVDAVRGAAATLNQQLLRADFLLCASEKQRDFWLGALASLGRVNPVVYDDDPSLDSLIALAPFGVTEAQFPEGPGALKGVVEGIGHDDQVVLWGGGVYNWFDPLTLVRAIDRLRHRLPGVRLYFLGLTHPNPEVPTMRMASDLRALTVELGLEGTHVFFNEGWVDYQQRASYLRDADVGVSTHLDHVETEFSFRTRILDYLWAGLPVVATGGDVIAEMIESAGAGVTVPAGDVEALEEALASLLADPRAAAAASAGSRALGSELTWSKNLAPLVSFCRDARRAPDQACPLIDASPHDVLLPGGLGRDLRVAISYLRSGHGAEMGARLIGRIRRRVQNLGPR